MNINDIEQQWLENTNKAMSQIRAYFQNPKDYEADFIKLAQFILNDTNNPWGYMPAGFQSSKENATDFLSFLRILHHAMVDDGDYVFISTDIHGPILLFADRHEKAQINAQVQERFSFLSREMSYTQHNDINRFIQEMQEYHKPKQSLRIKR